MSVDLLWEQRLVALSGPETMTAVWVFTPYGKRAAELCVLAVLAAHGREGYPMDALVG